MGEGGHVCVCSESDPGFLKVGGDPIVKLSSLRYAMFIVQL